MSPNLRTFIAIFCFLCGVVGAVLAIVNLNQEPVATTSAIAFGVMAMIGFISGWMVTKKPAY